MSGWFCLGLTSSKQQVKCLTQGYNTVTLAGSEARTSNPSIPSLMLLDTALCCCMNVGPDLVPEIICLKRLI